jgi:hypothetical protein
MVVRRQPDGNVWQFIVPLYVHGIMQGEAFQHKGESDLEQFTIE